MAEFSGRYDVGSLESTERKYSDWELVKRIIRDYMLRHRSLVAAMALIIIVKTALVLSGPYIYKVTLDTFISNTPESNEVWLANIIRGIAVMLGGGVATQWLEIIAAGLVYVAVGVALWCVMSLQEYYLNKLGLNIIADIRTDFFLHLEKLSQNFFEYGNTGKLVSRVTNDAEALRRLVSSGIIGVVADLVTAVAILGTMFLLNWQLAVVAVIMAPIIAVVTTTLNKFVRNNWRVARQNIASMTGKVQDLMVGAKVTKAMAQEEKSLADFNKVNVANAKAQIKAEVTANIYEATVGFFAALISTLVWFFGGQQVLGVYLAIGDLVAFIQYTTSYLEPIQNISTFYGEIQSALAGAERIFVVLDIGPEVKEAPDAVDFPEGEGIVELKDVRFSYVKDQPVLKGINIETRPGERLAIFGPTGSGKSSIINLVGRFYDPDSGIVTIDGVDLRNVKLKALRRKVGIVLQEPYLFQGTLRYNLKFGHPDASEEEMIRVAKLVGIHDPIMRLPQGYDEEIRERGSNLSYGQRQLVCLARALISDPKILIHLRSQDTHTRRGDQQRRPLHRAANTERA
jgi:ATP-binding cassette, subfamily B, multidrug efflux pump